MMIMKIRSWLLGLLVGMMTVAAVAKETIVIVPAHPDDLATSLGFCLVAKDVFDIHVVDFTHGERGLGREKFESGETKRVRMAEEQSVCDAVGAALHWLDEVDGEAYASQTACWKLADLIKSLKPSAVFAHWPVDVHTDHVMAGAAALRAVFLSGLHPEVYFFTQEYQAKGFVPDNFVDITSVAERKYDIVRLYQSQYRDGGIERRKRAGDLFYGMQTEMLAGGQAEGFKAWLPELNGASNIFSRLPKSPRAGRKMQGARERAPWMAQLPRPIFDEHPEWVDFYYRAWEIAHTRIDDLPGIPVPHYMDEAHVSNRIWIWDTCFMVHFCKYAPDEFPGIESLENFYEILMAKGNPPLPKVRGNVWCRADQGKMLDFKVHHADNPPLFAWTEYAYALQTGDRERLRRVYCEKRWLQQWYEHFESFDPAAPHPYGVGSEIALKRVKDGYHWKGCPSGMDNTARGRKGDKDTGSNAVCPNDPDLLWIDAYAQQALAAECIAKIASLLGREDEAEAWQAKYEEAKRVVNALYWDAADGFYYDIRESDHSKAKVPTLASYWPMLAGMPTREMADRLEDKLRDPQMFGGEIPTPSHARGDADFQPEGKYWRGAMWLPTTYMTIKAVDAYRDYALARELGRGVVRQMYRTYAEFEPHTIWECYSPTEPKPSTYAKLPGWVRSDFCGWSALGPIAIFIEDVIGIKEANAFANTLTCEFDPAAKGRVGIENYRFGNVVCSILSEGGEVTVNSNSAFTLIMGGVRHKIKPGVNVIK